VLAKTPRLKRFFFQQSFQAATLKSSEVKTAKLKQQSFQAATLKQQS